MVTKRLKKLNSLSAGRDWRNKARNSEPNAWAAFLRATKGHRMADRAELYWNFFLEGWKRRARAWPFNTLNGWYRKAVHGG